MEGSFDDGTGVKRMYICFIIMQYVARRIREKELELLFFRRFRTHIKKGFSLEILSDVDFLVTKEQCYHGTVPNSSASCILHNISVYASSTYKTSRTRVKPTGTAPSKPSTPVTISSNKLTCASSLRASRGLCYVAAKERDINNE